MEEDVKIIIRPLEGCVFEICEQCKNPFNYDNRWPKVCISCLIGLSDEINFGPGPGE